MRGLHNRMRRWSALCLILGAGALLGADDWPEWRGKGRLGVWNETGLLDTFPVGGLKVTWRTPIHAGYSGPAIADGRVFVTDARRVSGSRMIERLLMLDEHSGRILWTKEWDANYSGVEQTFAIGPRATPTVDGNRVYVLGTMGHLAALDVEDGRVLWQTDFAKEFGTEVPAWGMAGAPLVDGERLIVLVGGEPDAKVVAFNKRTGAEIWRALSSEFEPGYNQPVIVEAGGARQLLIWHPMALSSLNPETGTQYWEFPLRVNIGMTVATLVQHGPYLFLTSSSHGGYMLTLDQSKPAAALVWGGGSETPHSIISTPAFQGDYIYSMSQGQLGCWEVATGRLVWRTREVLPGRSNPNGTAFLVRSGDRYFINTERGELIMARLTPEGYQEISRTTLIEPTHPHARDPEGAVHWSHPAYANKHIVVRNDKEILSASLAKE